MRVAHVVQGSGLRHEDQAGGRRAGGSGADGADVRAHCRDVAGVLSRRWRDRRAHRSATASPMRSASPSRCPRSGTAASCSRAAAGSTAPCSCRSAPRRPATTPALMRGYAIVSTDSGHKGAVFDPSFFDDQEATLNFLYQAIGKVAPVGEGDRRGSLRQGGRSLVFRRLLHRRARGDDDVAAFSALFRRHRRRRAGDAHELLEPRGVATSRSR